MLFFPVTQIGEETVSFNEFAEGYFLERNGLLWFYEHYLPDDADRADPRVSPLKAADVSGLPPAYVMLAGFDPLHDEGLAYAEKLREAGVAVTVADYPDMVHDFIYMQAVLPPVATRTRGGRRSPEEGRGRVASPFRHDGISLPGLRMPLGSSVVLIARSTSRPSAPFSAVIQGR